MLSQAKEAKIEGEMKFRTSNLKTQLQERRCGKISRTIRSHILPPEEKMKIWADGLGGGDIFFERGKGCEGGDGRRNGNCGEGFAE